MNGALIGGAISAGVSIASIAAGAIVARRRGRGRLALGARDLMPVNLPFRPPSRLLPVGPVDPVPVVRRDALQQAAREEPRVCSRCGHHFRLRAEARLALLLDPGSWEERDAPHLVSVDVLGFVDTKAYPTGLRPPSSRRVPGMPSSGASGASVRRRYRCASWTSPSWVGPWVPSWARRSRVPPRIALRERLPLLVVSASGGARMQEGTLALMQLVRTCAAIARLGEAGVPYISLMTDPTTGGVFASFAALGDVNLAEPGALIGFAGTRVAAGTTGETLPEGFQRAEFLFRHGFVDRVVPRAQLRDELMTLLRYLKPRERRRPALAEALPVGDPAVLAAAARPANGRVHDASVGTGSFRRATDQPNGGSGAGSDA